MKKLLLLITLVLGVIAFALPGQAATLTLDLDLILPEKSTPLGPSPWLTVFFDDYGSAGIVDMTITSKLTASNPLAKWGLLYLNSDPILNATTDFLVTGRSGLTDYFDPTISTGDSTLKADGDGYFDIEVVFNTSDSGAFDNGEWIKYRITHTGLTAASFNHFSVGGDLGSYRAVGHLQASSVGGTWVGNVPIPHSILLLGSGLIGLVGFRRKKIAK